MDRTNFPVVMCSDEAAEFLGISVNLVLALAAKGELPGKKFGREWRFSRDALLESMGQKQFMPLPPSPMPPAVAPVSGGVSISNDDKGLLLRTLNHAERVLDTIIRHRVLFGDAETACRSLLDEIRQSKKCLQN